MRARVGDAHAPASIPIRPKETAMTLSNLGQENLGDVSRVSRRKFLRHSAVGAAAAASLPGILVFPSATRAAAADAQSKNINKDADYVLRVGRRKMAPDGRMREVFAYNDQIPGPLVRAKLGQKLRIKVINELGVPTSVHWHGMHQPGTWQMDGVDPVSHAPIPNGQEFTYEFTAIPAGTHWYHSHSGV